MSKRDEDLVEVVRVTHPVRKSDLSWSLEEEETKEESEKRIWKKSWKQGPRRHRMGQIKLAISSWTMGTQHQLCPKILLQSSRYQSHQSPILKVSKPSKPSMLQVSQSGIFQGVNLAFGSLCQAGGTRRIYLRQNMQTSGIFKYFLQSWQS